MLINDIYESRKYPEKNSKESVYDFLLRHANDPSMYVHMSSVPKVGINPKSAKRHSHDTPVGIFAFHLQTFISDIKLAKERGLSPALIFPYYGGSYWFILKGKQPYQNTLASYSDTDLHTDIAALKRIYDPELVDQSLSIAHTNENYFESPIGRLWGLTKAIAIGGTSELSHQQYPDALKWNRMLRKLGHHEFHDEGTGWIHGAEDTQSLFLDTSAFEIADMQQVYTKQLSTTIGNETYVGGRLPKHIELTSLNSTELMNIDTSNPANKKVQHITVKSVRNLNDITRLSSIFKNATISIDRIVVNRISELPRDGLPKKLAINELLFSPDFPTLPSEIEKLEKISDQVNTFGYPMAMDLENNAYYWKRFPDHLKTKIKGF